MSDEIEIKKARLAEVLALHKSMTPEELRDHDANNRARIDEIDKELRSEADPYSILDLQRERDELVEELSDTGPAILADEIEVLEGGA